MDNETFDEVLNGFKEADSIVKRLKTRIAELEEENKKLKDDIKKWEDRWMVRLAEIYLMPTRELTTAIAKNEWFSSWYDTVKKKMLHDLWFDRLDVQDLLKENKKLREENELLRCSKGWTPEKVWHEEMIQYLMGENKKLKEENEILKEYKSMYEWLCN